MHTKFYVITKIGLWASWRPKQKRKIRNMINYKCHVILKEKADQLLRRDKTFFSWILCGSCSGQHPPWHPHSQGKGEAWKLEIRAMVW